jgi:hypothetical protein
LVFNLGFPQFILFRTLGLCVVAAEAPRENHLMLLNSVWKVVSRLSDVGHYAACAEVWIEFAAKYFGVNLNFQQTSFLYLYSNYSTEKRSECHSFGHDTPSDSGEGF